MLCFVRTRTSGFENFPEFRKILNLGQILDFFSIIPNRPQISWRSQIYGLIWWQLNGWGAVVTSGILPELDQWTYMYYVTFIGVSLNKNCFVFIKVMQRWRQEDGFSHL
jgi:hypothetical protein